MSFRSMVLLFVFAVLPSFGSTLARVDSAWVNCTSTNASIRIDGCTTIINQRSRQTPRNRFIAYTFRAGAYKEKGENDLAIADYDTALEIDPRNVDAYVDRGDVYHREGKYDRAIADYDIAIKLNPANARAHAYRALSFLHKQSYDLALTDADIAVHLDPRLPVAIGMRASAYEGKGNLRAALADYKRLQAITPRSDDLSAAIARVEQNLAAQQQQRGTNDLIDRGDADETRGEHDQAIAEYDEALIANPNSAKAYTGRGNAYDAKGQHDRAIDDYDAAIHADPSDVNAYYDRGDTYEVKGDTERALTDFRKALELKPDSSNSAVRIARLEQRIAAAESDLQTRGFRPTEILPIIGHPGISSVAFSPDGTFIVSGGNDNTVRLWKIADGRLVRNFDGHSSFVTCVAFSPNGRFILSGGQDKTMRLWDIVSGRTIHEFVGHTDLIRAVAFSPDGTRVLSGSFDATVRLWDLASGRLLQTFSSTAGPIWSVAFSSDGRHVMAGAEQGLINSWAITGGDPVQAYRGHFGPVTSLAFSPDGRLFLSGSKDKTLRLWDFSSGQLKKTFLGLSNEVWSVAFARDGDKILSGSADGMKLWTISSADTEPLRSFSTEDQSVAVVGFSPDNVHVISGHRDGVLNVWDMATGSLVRRLGTVSIPVYSLAVSSDGTTISSGGADGTLRFWDAKTGRLTKSLQAHSREVKAITFSSDATELLSGSIDGTVWLWNSKDDEPIRNFEGNQKAVYSVAISRSGTRIMSGGEDKTIRLWDAGSGTLIHIFEGHSDAVRSVAFSPDGSRILSGAEDHTMRLWNAENGALVRVLENHPLPFSSVSFSPNGRQILSGCFDGTIKIWDADSGRLLHAFEGGLVTSASFSPDGGQVVAGGLDGIIMLWDVASGRLIYTFDDHSGFISSVAFSADGRRIFSGMLGGAMKIWSAKTGELLSTSLADKNGAWVTVTPEGFFDASEGGAKLLSLVRGLDVYSIDQVYQALYRPDLVREKLAGDPKGLVREAAAKINLDVAIGSGLPPDVKIASPANGASIEPGHIKAEIEVVDRGGGIGRVEWRVNGVTKGIESRGLGRLEDSAQGTLRLMQDLDLAPGDNTIEVSAYNSRNLVASLPVSVTVTVRPDTIAADPPKLYVLAVGVNDYWDSRLKLGFAVPDASAIAQAMVKAKGDLYADVETKLVVDSDATAEGLDKAFAELASKIHPQDTFVLFMAGHGKTEDGRYYFLPRDFRYEDANSIARNAIGQDRLQVWLAKIAATRSLLLIDTCESGSLTEDRVAERGLGRIVAVEKMTQAMGRTTITASTDDTPALEGYHGHGVFTYAVLQALGEADTDQDGKIEVTELITYLDRTVPELSYRAFKERQIPQTKFIGSNFSLGARTSVVPADDGMTSAVEAIPTKPTHVVISAADVFAEAGTRGVRVQRLAPGTLVSVIRTEQGWVLVARDGKRVGYVTENAVAKMQ